MNKRLATMLAATAVLGVTTAFAANPFSDVTPDSWAYQSVSQLAAAGVINGYPDGTFKGQNNITRYEMAQMVAKAMANQSRANAEQQAMINRLADEFSAELNNLGVRVANLEKKVGNVKVTGDARLRYQGYADKGPLATAANPDKKSKFDFRGRIQFNATVNDNTQAVVRVTTGNVEFGDSKTSDVLFDRMYVQHGFGDKTTLTAGRYGEWIGNGLLYDDAFDGIKLAYDNGKLYASAAYGKSAITGYTADENPSMSIYQLGGKIGQNVKVGGYYVDVNGSVDDKVFGGYADAMFGKVWVGGEYATMDEAENSHAWIAGIGYGNYNIAKKGSWDVKAQRYDFEENAPIWSTTFTMPYTSDAKGWLLTADYALAKNLGLSAYYAFDQEEKTSGADLSDYYRAQLNYKF